MVLRMWQALLVVMVKQPVQQLSAYTLKILQERKKN
jgi:hypothetical protein